MSSVRRKRISTVSRVLWPHPHSEQLADTFHLWIIGNNLLHVANAGTVGPLSHEESSGFNADRNGHSGLESSSGGLFMIVHFLHGRTHLPLYATPAVAKPEVWALLQSPPTPIRRFLYDRFSRQFRHHHFCQLTTSGSDRST
jgi:hypothetical protein